jgi:uncharacterized protein (TIGR00299 family) protein
MILGALVDVGVSLDALRGELAKLGLPGWRLAAREVRRGAFRATKVDVEVEGGAHEHRHLADIVRILEASGLARPVVDGAVRIFRRLAEAEARAHGSSVDEVHFHEVGAVDAIVDVTGAVVALGLLGAETIHVSALPIGGGFVESAHGRMPIPGPGTAELLRNFPVVDTGVQMELVTPTGAAILTTLAAGAGRMPAMTVERVGYGAGSRDLPGTPNVLRVFVGEVAGSPATETVAQVETTIDDMSPQLYEPLMERLFEAGALDVFLTPVIMKRSRPGTVLTALCAPERVGDLSRVLFEESSTIGLRWTEVSRARLEREMVTIQTAYGALPFKVSRLAGRVVTVTPEFADVVRLAREKSLAVREVLEQARTDARRHFGD